MNTLNPWLPLPDDWQSQPDEKLGWWLVAAWIGMHADKAGIPRNAIAPTWAEGLIRSTADLDSDSVENAALENAFRKACNGDMTTAGRMLREIVTRGAVEIVKDKMARTGAKQLKGAADGHKTRSQQSQADAEDWQATAAALWGKPQHLHKNASDIARLIDEKRWNTIRRKIRKPRK